MSSRGSKDARSTGRSSRATVTSISSSRPSSTKERSKSTSRCSKIIEAFEKWANRSGTGDNYEAAKSVIAEYKEHMSSTCKCVPLVGLHYLTGNAYFELFLATLKKFNKKVATTEEELFPDDDESTKPTKSGFSEEDPRENPNVQPVNEECKPSKLHSHSLNQLVNLRSHAKLVSPLLEAIKYWSLAADSTEYKDCDVSKLKVSGYMIAACYVLNCYRLLGDQEKCARLLVKIATEPVELLTGHCFLASLCLETGQVDEAKIYIQLASEIEAQLRASTSSSDSHEIYLYLLIKCEVDLATDPSNSQKSAKILWELINSDYLKKLTLNRYFVKGSALLLASKYPVEDYPYSRDHQEFVEPVQIGICLVKRWHRGIFEKDSDKNPKDASTDQTWYKFASYSLTLKAYEVVSTFSVSCGQPVELLFYHNPLLKLCRQNCFIFWVQRLLVIGAQVDKITDKISCRTAKINNALNVTSNGESEQKLKIKSLGNSSMGQRAQLKKSSVSSGDDFVICQPEEHRGQACSCLHELNFIPWHVKRQAMKYSESSELDDTDEVFVKETALPVFSASDSGIHGLVLVHLELLIELMSTKRNYGNLIDRLSRSQDPLNELRKEIGLVKSSINADMSTQRSFETAMKLAILLMRHLITTGQNASVVSLARKWFRVNSEYVESYQNRVLIASIVVTFLTCKLETISEKPKRIFYDAYEQEEKMLFSTSSKSYSAVRVSSPVAKRKSTNFPMAPKKQPYKMEVLQEYYAAQSNEMAKISKGTHSPLARVLAKYSSPSKDRTEFRTTRSTRSSAAQPKLSHKSIDFEVEGDAKKTTKRVIKSSKENLPTIKRFSSRQELGRNKSSNDFTEPMAFPDHLRPKKHSSAVDQLVHEFESLDVSPKAIKGDSSVRLFRRLINCNTVIDIKETLNYLLLYMGNHPPAKLYTEVHALLGEVYLMKTTFSKRLSGYSFAESASCASLRYRCLRIAEKKQRRQMEMKLRFRDFTFGDDGKQSATKLEEQLAQLPDGWRITQISAVNFKGSKRIPDLNVVRFQKGKKPLTMTIVGNPEKHVKDFMAELSEIIELSNGSIINKDATKFWKVRYALDSRLKVLVDSIETSWFGPFKGLLIGKVIDKTFCDMCDSMQRRVLVEASKLKLSCLDVDVLSMVIESYPVLSPDELLSSMALLFTNYSQDFLNRCSDILDDEFANRYPIDSKLTIMTSLGTAPIGLVLNTHLEQFPFESLPSLLAVKQEVFRVPSLLFMASMLMTFKETSMFVSGANEKSVFYLLNPADNLGKTEEAFKQRFDNEKDWTGVASKKPEPKELALALQTKDIYIFFGHGAGTSYYRLMPDNLEGLTVNSAALVIGCSSGRLTSDGQSLETYGTAYRFLLNGAPCYVGVLWDVTDRDIDKFSDKMLENWLPNWGRNSHRSTNSTISLACTEARSACKLKYLIGAAPVVYGLPIQAYLKTLAK